MIRFKVRWKTIAISRARIILTTFTHPDDWWFDVKFKDGNKDNCALENLYWGWRKNKQNNFFSRQLIYKEPENYRDLLKRKVKDMKVRCSPTWEYWLRWIKCNIKIKQFRELYEWSYIWFYRCYWEASIDRIDNKLWYQVWNLRRETKANNDIRRWDMKCYEVYNRK